MSAPAQETTPTPEARAQALRLAREAKVLAQRVLWERELAVYEAEGRPDYSYARMLRARLDGDREAESKAEITYWAEAHVLYGRAAPPEIDADRLTEEVIRLREARQH